MPAQLLLDLYMEDLRCLVTEGNSKALADTLSDIRKLLASGNIVGKSATRLRTRKRELEQALACLPQRNPGKVIEEVFDLLGLVWTRIGGFKTMKDPPTWEVDAQIASADEKIQTLNDEEKSLFADRVSLYEKNRGWAIKQLGKIRKRVRIEKFGRDFRGR